MPLTPNAVHDAAEAVLGCVCAALDAAAEEVEGQPGCPCRACVVPGTVAWDGCEADPCGQPSADAPGQLTVSVARLYPSSLDLFPGEARPVQGIRGCAPPPFTAVELVVTLLRCAPVMDENGCPPTCEEQDAAARVLHTDAVTVYNALWCCLPGVRVAGSRRPPRFVVGGQRIIGPQGGCVGLEQRVTLALPGCGVCPGGETS
ncbi:hypothetical protein OIE91_11140 [Streptomyces albidoflavus]|uniref:hypothetical protein n=1 Tax=Streptomyces albidoflavus TaxID=1886 RepID=UPI00352EFEBF